MKKILFLVVAALLMSAVSTDAKTRRLITDLGATETLANSAIDTLGVFPFHENLQWNGVLAATDGSPSAYLLVTFTAASTVSFSVVIDYMVNEVADTHLTTVTDFVARTSGAMYMLALDPGFPAEGIRVRLANTDVTGTAACTNLDAYLIQILDD